MPRRVYVTLLAACCTLGVLQGAESRFTAQDMLEITRLARGQPVRLSPDGRWVSYVLPRKGYEWNILARRPRGDVYLEEVDSGEGPRALSQGETWSAFPVWSPDGKYLALFLEDEKGGRLALWDRATAQLRLLGERYAGRAYLAPQWAPRGRGLVYAAPEPAPEPAPAARVRVLHSSDARLPGDRFFTDHRRARLRRIDLEGKRSRPLEEQPLYLRSFRLSPTGERLIYVAVTPQTLGLVGREVRETWMMELETGKARQLEQAGRILGWMPRGEALLTARGGKLSLLPASGGRAKVFPSGVQVPVRPPRWSPDGRRLLLLVRDPTLFDPEIEPPRPGMYSIARPFTDLYLVDAASGREQNLTASIEDRVSDPLWSPDGRYVYFRAVDRHSYQETLYRYRSASGKLEALERGDYHFDHLSTGGDRLLAARQDAAHPADLWLFEGSGQGRRLTRLNPQLEHFRFSRPQLFYFTSAEGDRLGALLYKPVGFRPGKKVPVITYVYEKLTPGRNRFSARHQVFLNQGYALLMPNVKVKVGRTGTSFVRCVVPAVEAVRKMGWTNGKFAIWGGSFGAYATSYLITQTDIFACAVSRATPPELFRNWASGRDRDSINIERGQARMGGSPFEVQKRYLSQSAFFHLDRVHTPVLLLHGVEDHTILFGEGAMMFYALRRLGKKATFVIYTHGDHSLSRHSRADTLDVYRQLSRWFGRYLKGGGR